MNDKLAETYAKMLWVLFIIIIGGLVYYFMPPALQVWLMSKLEWVAGLFKK